MTKIIALLLMMASTLMSAQVTFFIQVPPSRNWLNENPILVENNDGLVHQMQTAGENGWYSYSWEKDDMPDSIFVYSAKDSAYSSPLGCNYYDKGSVQNAIKVKSLVEIFLTDSIYYISDDFCWIDGETQDGFYGVDVRDKSLCGKGDYEFVSNKMDLSMFVILPSYGDWSSETPILVDSANQGYKREMSVGVVNDVKGFYYHWQEDEWVPENLLIYMKSDSALIHPVGSTGLAAHLNSGLVGTFFEENEKTIAISPDECIRNDLAANWPELNTDHRPTCFLYIDPVALFYSVYSNDSSLLVSERRSIDSTEIAYYDANRQRVYFRGDSLDDGKYIVKIRLYDYDEYREFTNSFIVENGRISSTPISRKGDKSRARIEISGRNLLISSARETPYHIFNSLGQVVFRGRIQGMANVVLSITGSYIVKVGDEIRRIDVR